jgi:hypothetical protein
MLSPSAATEPAPFEAELRSTFGAPHAELPARALQFARAAATAAGRPDAFERALAVSRLLLLQGADPETIARRSSARRFPNATWTSKRSSRLSAWNSRRSSAVSRAPAASNRSR